MGSYVERYWFSDSAGMNKAERMGGAYRLYVPDMLEGFELLMEPSCASAVARAQEALRSLTDAGSLTDTEPLARLLLRAEAVSSSRIEGLEMPAGRLLEYEELDRLGVEHRLDSTEAQVLGNLHALVDGLGAAERRGVASRSATSAATARMRSRENRGGFAVTYAVRARCLTGIERNGDGRRNGAQIGMGTSLSLGKIMCPIS